MITFKKDQIEFEEYPFSPATIYPNGILHADKIEEILLEHAPPEVRTKAGEVIFIYATYKVQLKEFARSNNIPIVNRIDTWDLILDEFLDTEFSDDYKNRTLAILESCSITREECLSIRESVKALMIGYNFGSMLWEWVHLGLYDLLKAYSGQLTESNDKISQEEFGDIYWKSMDIANKGIMRV